MDKVLTIESDEAVRLAEQLAQLTGQPAPAVVLQALAEKMTQQRAKHDADALAAELLAIGRRCAAKLKGLLNSADHAELCGDGGMPA